MRSLNDRRYTEAVAMSKEELMDVATSPLRKALKFPSKMPITLITSSRHFLFESMENQR